MAQDTTKQKDATNWPPLATNMNANQFPRWHTFVACIENCSETPKMEPVGNRTAGRKHPNSKDTGGSRFNLVFEVPPQINNN